MCQVAQWHVQFIGSNYAQIRISKLPPPLMADYTHMDSTRRLPCVLHIVNRTNRSQHQYEDDEHRNSRPGKLDLIAPIQLCRLTRFIGNTCAETYDTILKQAKDNEKDRRSDSEYKPRQRCN